MLQFKTFFIYKIFPQYLLDLFSAIPDIGSSKYGKDVILNQKSNISLSAKLPDVLEVVIDSTAYLEINIIFARRMRLSIK